MKTPGALCLLFASFFSNLIFAGDPKIKLSWGQEYELPKKHFDLGFIGDMHKGFVQLSHQYGKSLVLQKFSPALKLTGEKTIDLKGMPKGYWVEDFVNWGGQEYWLYSVWEKKAAKEHLFVQKVDIVKGDLSGKPQELIETDKVTGSLVATGFYQFQRADKYTVSFSSDSAKMFVYVKYPHKYRDDSKNYEEFGFWVFDQNFKVIWKNRITMPYTEKKITIKDVQTDRNGDFLFLVKAYNDDTRKDIRDNAPNFHFEILKFNSGSAKPVIIPFQFGDKFVSQLNLVENEKGDIVCCGFYGNKDKNGKLTNNSGKVDGSFFMHLDLAANKLENIHKGFYEIPNEVFKEYESERTVKKIEKKEAKGEDLSASNMRLRHVIFGADGSLLLLGEKYYEVTYTVRNGNSYYTRTNYYYQDILGQYIDGDGNLVWTKKIPKNQVGGNSTFGLGFKLVAFNGDNYLFFLDNIKNLNLAKNEAPAMHTAGAGGVLMGVKVDKSGNMDKVKVFDTRDVKEKIDIVGADRVGPTTLIDRTWNKKISKICLINIVGGEKEH